MIDAEAGHASGFDFLHQHDVRAALLNGARDRFQIGVVELVEAAVNVVGRHAHVIDAAHALNDRRAYGDRRADARRDHDAPTPPATASVDPPLAQGMRRCVCVMGRVARKTASSEQRQP